MTHLHIRDDTKKGQIDTTEHGKVIIDSVRRLQEDLSAIIYEPEWTEARLVNWLDSGSQQDVTKPSSILFISKVLEVLKAEDYSLDELARHKYQLRDAIRKYISVLRKDRQDGSYNALFATHANQFSLSSDHTIIFDEDRYAYNQPYRGPRRFNKHYTEIIGDLEASGEEFDCACFIDNLKEVKHWIRNTDKRPYSFWL